MLLGDNAVGKTSLIQRYVFNQFKESYAATIGTKVTMKELKVRIKDETYNIVLMIWDLIGREGYSALHARTMVGVNGALLVADLTREETLYSLERYWIPFLFKVVENVPLVFACNKSDLTGQFQFQPDDLADIAKRYNKNVERVLPPGYETTYSTSAKDGSNVEKTFETLSHLLLSSDELVDPVKELYENLMATKIRRLIDKTSAIGALGEIIMNFCDGFKDSRVAMLVLRQEVARAGLNINNPKKENIFKLVEYLAESEVEFKDEKLVMINLEKRNKLVENIKE